MANLIPFTKRFESSENLVNLLESRGLQICDRNKAIQYRDNIGYYRLSAYMYPLLKMPKTAHLYKEGSTFEKVMMLYRFDKKLRLLMFNEIEKIEIAIRRAVMQITADMTGNPFWLTDSSYFLNSHTDQRTIKIIKVWEKCGYCEYYILNSFAKLKVSHPFYKNGHTEWFKFISDESSLIRTVESIISNLT